MAIATSHAKVRELQRTLYRAAKADPKRRFHALYDKVYRTDVLERAWELVRANRGAAGIDKQTIADVEQYGIARLLDELATDLQEGKWRPLPARRVFIAKPGRDELRPLSIPAVRDRIVQAAVRIVVEPIFEADMTTLVLGPHWYRNGARLAESAKLRLLQWGTLMLNNATTGLDALSTVRSRAHLHGIGPLGTPPHALGIVGCGGGAACGTEVRANDSP
jgi:retron-type reverse transcriptase